MKERKMPLIWRDQERRNEGTLPKSTSRNMLIKIYTFRSEYSY